MKKSSAPDDSTQYPALHYVFRLLSLCSLRCLFRLARLLGFVVQHTRNQISVQTRENIDLCFPHLPEQQRRELVKDAIVHTCAAFIELASVWYQPVSKSLAKVDIEYIDEEFEHSERARLVIVPHHGSWEIMSYWLGAQGEAYSLYKPSRKKTLDRFILEHRSRNGVELVPTSTAGLRRLLSGLKRNATCMVLPDQRPAKNTGRVDSQIFDHPAKTSLLVKNLAQRVECDVFIAALKRDLDTGRYQLNLQRLDREALLQEDASSAAYLNQRIEDLVSNQICQYQWSYRRFDESAYQGMDSNRRPG